MSLVSIQISSALSPNFAYLALTVNTASSHGCSWCSLWWAQGGEIFVVAGGSQPVPRCGTGSFAGSHVPLHSSLLMEPTRGTTCPACKIGAGVQQISRRVKLYIYSSVLLISRHGSGKTSTNVRVDLRLLPKMVFRFNVGRSGTNCLSPVLVSLNLRLKFSNPRKHSSVRLSRGAPAVLLACMHEDSRCLHLGLSFKAWRLRWRHHLWRLQRECGYQIVRSSFTHTYKLNFMSHCSDSSLAVMELHPCLMGLLISLYCTWFS
ncbi:hypothetical protein BS78_09G111700 [Paspalum vaginatum]|nr:hypothetical protein BS78_09G111700 [Paspalum vaginatum]